MQNLLFMAVKIVKSTLMCKNNENLENMCSTHRVFIHGGGGNVLQISTLGRVILLTHERVMR